MNISAPDITTMIIFLYGQDTYRSQQKLNEIIGYYKKTHQRGLDLSFFEEKNFNLDEIFSEIQTVSMFKEKKLIIFKNVLNSSEQEDKILKFLQKNKDLEGVIIIYEKKEVKETSPLVKFLKKNAKSQEFKPLSEEGLKKWLKKEILNYKTEVSPAAIDELIYFVGSDLWRLSNEVKKLVNYKKREKIETEDVDSIVSPRIEPDIFKTIDAIAARDKKQAISLIHKHLEKGESPLYLLTMINFQFRNLLIVKDLIEKKMPYYAIFRITKMHPFLVKKTYQQTIRFSYNELKKIYQKIFQVDSAIKTGKILPEVALDLFLSEISQSTPSPFILN